MELDEALRAALNGDEYAFRTVFRDLQPRLIRYLNALVGPEAEDVAAETWSQIARDRHSFDGDYGSFRGWATTIARNRAIDLLRRKRRRPEDPSPIEDMVDLMGTERTAPEALDRIATANAIALIAMLPRQMAEAVLLRVIIGLSAKETAHILGTSSGAIRSATYRGLRKLAEHVDPVAPDAQTMVLNAMRSSHSADGGMTTRSVGSRPGR